MFTEYKRELNTYEKALTALRNSPETIKNKLINLVKKKHIETQKRVLKQFYFLFN